MIDKIHLKNIKGFEDEEIPFSSFNLLSGTNGVGKSTAIQALLFRSQDPEKITLEGSYQYQMPLDFGYFNLGLSGDIIRRSRNSDEIFIKYFESDNTTTFHIQESKEDDYLTIINDESDWTRLSLQYLNAERIGPRTIYNGKTVSSKEEYRINFLGVFGELASSYLAAKPTQIIDQRLLNVIQRKNNYGENDDYKLIEGVNIWLGRIKSGVTVFSKYDKETNQSILRFDNSNRPINDGFGLSIVLPIIILILAAPPNSVIIVENPEAHLHPSGQYYIGQLLCLAASIGHQIFVETHSDHILNAVRLSIKDGLLSSNMTNILHFYKDSQTNTSKVKKIDVDNTGVLSDSPEGFFDEYTKRLRELW